MLEGLIPHDLARQLMLCARATNMASWEIGDITNLLLHRYEDNRKVKKYQVYAAVGQVVSLSAKRVEKVARVSAAFPEDMRAEFPFADFPYWERAYDLPDQKERLEAIEFIRHFEAEYNRKLRVTEFIPMFRELILGEHAFDPVPAPSQPPPPPYPVGELPIGKLLWVDEDGQLHQDAWSNLQQAVLEIKRQVVTEGVGGVERPLPENIVYLLDALLNWLEEESEEAPGAVAIP